MSIIAEDFEHYEGPHHKQKPRVHMSDWKIVRHPWDGCRYLHGLVVDHPRGRYIYTSTILAIDEANNLVETRNTIYILENQPV